MAVQYDYTRDEPLLPEKALKICKLRRAGMKLKDIAVKFNHTPAGILHYVNRWDEWAIAEEAKRKQKKAERKP